MPAFEGSAFDTTSTFQWYPSWFTGVLSVALAYTIILLGCMFNSPDSGALTPWFYAYLGDLEMVVLPSLAAAYSIVKIAIATVAATEMKNRTEKSGASTISEIAGWIELAGVFLFVIYAVLLAGVGFYYADALWAGIQVLQLEEVDIS